MAKKEQFNEILEEMLDLAGVPLSEAEDDEEENQTDVEVEPEDQEDQENQENDDTEGEELQDKWEVNISTKGTFKIEWTDSYVWIWYKNQRSDKIAIPAKLRPYRPMLSSFLNKLLSWVEEKS